MQLLPLTLQSQRLRLVFSILLLLVSGALILAVSNRIAWSHIDIKAGAFMMTPDYVLNGTMDGLIGSIVHDAFHKTQANAKTDYAGTNAEKAASSFALGVAMKLGLDEVTLQNLCRDSKFGHKSGSTDPYKKRQKTK